MKYVACKFRSADTRSYTYEWDGEPLAVGDFVKVDERGGGWKRVEVVSISDEKPPFACKPILGKITGEDDDAAITRKFHANLSRSNADFPEGIADQ